jgi:hypothetical protein
MHPEVVRVRNGRAVPQALQLLLAEVVITSLSIGASVQLDRLGTYRSGTLNLRLIRVYKQRHPNPGLPEARDSWLQHAGIVTNVKATFGRQLGALFRHQTAVCGPQFERYAEHFFGHSHLEIKPGSKLVNHAPDIGVLNMPSILAQVHGNTVCTRRLGLQSSDDRARIPYPARLPKRRDMIDIDTE